MQDVALRRAVVAGMNREAIAKVRFQGLDYEEKQPGSMIHMPFSEYYQDVYPTPNNDAAAASKILEEAGYTKNGEFYEKDGKQAAFSTRSSARTPPPGCCSDRCSAAQGCRH